MEQINFIHNTGIQYYELPDELVIDLNANVMKALRYHEFQFGNKIYLDPAYYFPIKAKYLRRGDLIGAGYLDPNTNYMMDESEINEAMNWLEAEDLLTVNRIDVTVGDKKLSALEQIEGKWLPMPYFYNDVSGTSTSPTNWCRIKLIENKQNSTKSLKHYKVVMAFDTMELTTVPNETPTFQGEPFLDFSLCGIPHEAYEQMDEQAKKIVTSMLVPLKAYDFCRPDTQTRVNDYIQELFNSTNLDNFEPGKKMKYLVYYIYLITYLYHRNVLPEVRLYNDTESAPIATNLVLDVGNSRAFGMVAEDPIDTSFSKAAILQIRDLETGEVQTGPFDMRLCFKEELFGLPSFKGTFRWPSVVRLGKEALRTIYEGEEDLMSPSQFDTSHSSPKRFLWDTKPYHSQWKYISERERTVGPARTVDFSGLMEQFYSDGRFAVNPQEMGDKSSYSRSSLMTFCFIEILLQVRQQINSFEFRRFNGQDFKKRVIKRVILTCPTAMSREEQRILRRCMEEASIVLRRYYSNTYNEPYDPEADHEKIEIIPSVRDLSLSVEDSDLRRSWNYDEATCCQMVYLYSEMRRYMGNANEFFKNYGRRRNGEDTPSLTIGSLDIGAGTTDIMICNYVNTAESIKPTPLFWESFKIAGDDLVKRIIMDVLLESPQVEYPEASGIIVAKLKSMGIGDISNKMNHFFGDTHNMGVIEKRMRKEFMIQVLHPVATFLLDQLQKGNPEKAFTFRDIFTANQPSKMLLDFFDKQMGFKFEDLIIRFSPKYLNDIIRRVFEKHMRKWAALFHSFGCDIVLINGRPCSLKMVQSMIRRLMPVMPNRLVSMSNYRVGSWYPGGSSDIGHFSDNKSMVAVGALIAYLAEQGKLSHFKLNTEALKTKVLPTTEYVGIINPHSGTIKNILSPDCNGAYVDIAAFPVPIGTKQFDVDGYPSNMLYMLSYNETFIRQQAINTLKKRLGVPPDAPDSALAPDKIAMEIETIKFRLRNNSPLRIRLEREYHEDKEKVKIDSIEDNDRNELSNHMLELSLQTWSEDDTNWLDTGVFKLHINL